MMPARRVALPSDRYVSPPGLVQQYRGVSKIVAERFYVSVHNDVKFPDSNILSERFRRHDHAHACFIAGASLKADVARNSFLMTDGCLTATAATHSPHSHGTGRLVGAGPS